MRLRSHQAKQMRIKRECSAFIALFIISDLCVISSYPIFLFAILSVVCVCGFACVIIIWAVYAFFYKLHSKLRNILLRSHFHSCWWWLLDAACDAMRCEVRKSKFVDAHAACLSLFLIPNKANSRLCFQNQCLYAFIDFTPCISCTRRCFTFATYHLSLFASYSLQFVIVGNMVGIVFRCCCCCCRFATFDAVHCISSIFISQLFPSIAATWLAKPFHTNVFGVFISSMQLTSKTMSRILASEKGK